MCYSESTAHLEAKGGRGEKEQRKWKMHAVATCHPQPFQPSCVQNRTWQMSSGTQSIGKVPELQH